MEWSSTFEGIKWDAILTGFISNVLFAVFFFLSVLLVANAVVLKTRARRLRVLSIDKRSGGSTLPIYIAHLVIVKGGALLADGTPSLYFEGRAVPLREVEAAHSIKNLIHSGLIELLPDGVLSRLAGVSAGFFPVKISVGPSPLDVNKVKNLPRAIIIGGPEFNAATCYFMEKAGMFTILDPKDCVHPTITIKNRDGVEELIMPDSPDYNIGVVQRVSFERGKQVVLILTGVGSNGTLAAVDWFLKNWDQLNKRVGNQDFGICLQCPRRVVDPQGYLRWTLRREFPEGIMTGSAGSSN